MNDLIIEIMPEVVDESISETQDIFKQESINYTEVIYADEPELSYDEVANLLVKLPKIIQHQKGVYRLEIKYHRSCLLKNKKAFEIFELAYVNALGKPLILRVEDFPYLYCEEENISPLLLMDEEDPISRFAIKTKNELLFATFFFRRPQAKRCYEDIADKLNELEIEIIEA